MASKTKKLETIRDRKAARRGRKRKAALRTKGSTKSQQALFGDTEAAAPKVKKAAVAAKAKKAAAPAKSKTTQA